MKRFLLIALCGLLTLTFAQAQTLGASLQSVESQAQGLVSRYSAADTWGQQTAVDDLKRFLAQVQRLSAALSGDDATSVEQLQRGFSSAARRMETSSVMLPSAEEQTVTAMVAEANQIDQRLTELRLRFGSKASLVSGSLAEVPLHPGEEIDGVYTNLQHLLIDVRDAVRLASTLGNDRFPGNGIGFGTPNNLEPLQVRRFVLAGWELERQLSVQIEDVSETYPAWELFEREYNRLGHPGSSANIRQLERVMERLGSFYNTLD
jgi:hypothetical protein